LTAWLIILTWLIASIDTRSNGFFMQERIGRFGRRFTVIKIKTMRDRKGTLVTRAGDPRITTTGLWLRRFKLDELPQLINVLLGQMSFVGPRPDVASFADQLQGDERLILSVRPGITGPATLKYRDEEQLLAGQSEPERYNREVIWPDKVRLNLAYVRNWGFWSDLVYIKRTLLP